MINTKTPLAAYCIWHEMVVSSTVPRNSLDDQFILVDKLDINNFALSENWSRSVNKGLCNYSSGCIYSSRQNGH